jgi:hypothetical protein
MNQSRSLLPGLSRIVLALLAGLVLVPAQTTAEPLAAKPKRFVIPFRGPKPLKTVFTWLSEETEMPVVSNYMPWGSITFTPPNPPRSYTLPEVMDIINDGMSQVTGNEHFLIRRPRGFTLLPADKKVDESMIPRIPLAALEQYGRTELVSVVLHSRVLVASDWAPLFRKLQGPLGGVVVVDSGSSLLVYDMAGNVRRLCRLHQILERLLGG